MVKLEDIEVYKLSMAIGEKTWITKAKKRKFL